KTYARRGVPPMVGHAAFGNPRRNSALHPAVVRIGSGRSEKCVARNRIDAAVSGNVKSGIEIVGEVVQFAIGAEKTHAQSQIQREALGGMPIVLKKRFVNVVEVVPPLLELSKPSMPFAPVGGCGSSFLWASTKYMPNCRLWVRSILVTLSRKVMVGFEFNGPSGT